MVEFYLPLEPTDYIMMGEKEQWTYITDNSVSGIEPNRYLISNFGRIYDLVRNERCAERYFSGYKSVSLRTSNGTNSYLLHRIVVKEFIGPNPSEEENIVNHKNGVKQCCLDDNLEWVTEKRNREHAI